MISAITSVLSGRHGQQSSLPWLSITMGTSLTYISFLQVYGANDNLTDTVDPAKGEILIKDIQAYRATLSERFRDDE